MCHCYDFFDRAFFDPIWTIWTLSWRENWRLLELDAPSPLKSLRAKEHRFRNLLIASDLQKAQAKASDFKRPNVFRQVN